MNYVRPVLKQNCPNCGKESILHIEDINEFGEGICNNCNKPFWSTLSIDFIQKVKK